MAFFLCNCKLIQQTFPGAYLGNGVNAFTVNSAEAWRRTFTCSEFVNEVRLLAAGSFQPRDAVLPGAFSLHRPSAPSPPCSLSHTQKNTTCSHTQSRVPVHWPAVAVRRPPAVSHADESERGRMRKDGDKWQDYLTRQVLFFLWVAGTEPAVGAEGNV